MLSITRKSAISPRLRPFVICVGLALMQGAPSHADEVTGVVTTNGHDEKKGGAQERHEDGETVMKSVVVTGQHESQDERGRNEVFEKDVVNVYQGKEEIERYKVNSVGDLLNGLNGVYSGDSRNSGALDPNIRGLQGGGRIPVTIDGTEQATSVWLGPAGVANRNYLDPNLVGSVMAEKGPSMTPGVSSGIGGSIQVRTLEPDDIVRPGETFGIEIKASTASNSVKPNESSFSNFGKDYRDIPGAYATYSGYLLVIPPGPHDTDITPRSGSSGKALLKTEWVRLHAD
ncbi:TonB-dependent receptor plug domain-containing protein [Thauera butanivorans]|uniref:TonB-dependent receptor plug domain-containing protein n=1 Tax=Thauera butanivorans TaxID=86174 RepID=UPI003AB781A6